jgi:hypothetical protein
VSKVLRIKGSYHQYVTQAANSNGPTVISKHMTCLPSKATVQVCLATSWHLQPRPPVLEESWVVKRENDDN